MTTDTGSLDALVERIETALAERLPRHSEMSPALIDAMRYATLGGGKRIRPLLTCATATSLGVDVANALAPACAVEFMHAYSLIHDDLPSMDDDDLRRGRPTVHIAFNEATAILAGDALQALAFETLLDDVTVPPAARLDMVRVLARAVGWQGMVGGQAFDMDATGRAISVDALERMHRGKTGALLCASVELGAIASGADDRQRAALCDFGAALGLAFQIVDDLLDVTQSTQRIGKRAGADADLGKNTFPGLLGIDGARDRAIALHSTACDALRRAGIANGTLHALAAQIVERTH
jgi:geranylgeranyl diphosphate synthase, type II